MVQICPSLDYWAWANFILVDRKAINFAGTNYGRASKSRGDSKKRPRSFKICRRRSLRSNWRLNREYSARRRTKGRRVSRSGAGQGSRVQWRRRESHIPGQELVRRRRGLSVLVRFGGFVIMSVVFLLYLMMLILHWEWVGAPWDLQRCFCFSVLQWRRSLDSGPGSLFSRRPFAEFRRDRELILPSGSRIAPAFLSNV
jgi:hypothetical protein